MSDKDRKLSTILNRVRENLRPCSAATVGGFRPPTTELTSWFGGKFLALPNEEWPANSNGPMIPLLQVVTSELPVIPAELQDIAVLTTFIDRQELPVPTPAPAGDSWQIRSYPTAADLRPISDPIPVLKPFPVRWNRNEHDAPSWTDTDNILDRESFSLLAENMDCFFEEFSRCGGTKVGGWPAYIQGVAQLPRGRFVIQIASEPKSGWMWGDSGNAYLFRKDDGSWDLAWDCY